MLLTKSAKVVLSNQIPSRSSYAEDTMTPANKNGLKRPVRADPNMRRMSKDSLSSSTVSAMIDIPGGSVNDTEAAAHRIRTDVETWRSIRTIVLDTGSVRAIVVTLAVYVHALVGHATCVESERKACAKTARVIHLSQVVCTPVVDAIYVISCGTAAGTRMAWLSVVKATRLMEDELVRVRIPSGSDQPQGVPEPWVTSPQSSYVVG